MENLGASITASVNEQVRKTLEMTNKITENANKNVQDAMQKMEEELKKSGEQSDGSQNSNKTYISVNGLNIIITNSASKTNDNPSEKNVNEHGNPENGKKNGSDYVVHNLTEDSHFERIPLEGKDIHIENKRKGKENGSVFVNCSTNGNVVVRGADGGVCDSISNVVGVTGDNHGSFSQGACGAGVTISSTSKK